MTLTADSTYQVDVSGSDVLVGAGVLLGLGVCEERDVFDGAGVVGTKLAVAVGAGV